MSTTRLDYLSTLVTDDGNGPGDVCGPGRHPVPLGTETFDNGRLVDHHYACTCSAPKAEEAIPMTTPTTVHAAQSEIDQLLTTARAQGRISDADAVQYAAAYAERPTGLQAALARLAPVPGHGRAVQAAAGETYRGKPVDPTILSVSPGARA